MNFCDLNTQGSLKIFFTFPFSLKFNYNSSPVCGAAFLIEMKILRKGNERRVNIISIVYDNGSEIYGFARREG